jgi:hypothetical protein
MLRNVKIETWSGDGSVDICSVNGRTDVRHFVRMTSYKTYPVMVNCTGSIASDPLMTKFHCPEDPAVSSREWQATNLINPKIGRQDPNSCEFNHVRVHAGDVPGEDNISTDVRISWGKRASDSCSLGFDISS